MLGPVPDLPAPDALVGRIAVQLARQGAAGLNGALRLLVEGTGARSAVLYRTDADEQVLATAGEVIRSVSSHRPGGSGVELVVPGPDGHGAATLRVTGVRPHVLPLLRDVVAVLGLVLTALSSGPTGPSTLVDVEAERSALADALHDGPLQELVAARFAADLAVRGGADPLLRVALQDALVALRRHVWQLRPRGSEGLTDALGRLSLQLVERGSPPLRLHLDPTADVLSATEGVVAYRLVQAVAADPAPPRDPVTVRLVRQDAPGGRHVLALSVDGGPGLRDPARWRRTVAALGGDLLCCPGRLRLALPVPAGPVPVPAHAAPTVPPEPLPDPPPVRLLTPTAKAVL